MGRSVLWTFKPFQLQFSAAQYSHDYRIHAANKSINRADLFLHSFSLKNLSLFSSCSSWGLSNIHIFSCQPEFWSLFSKSGSYSFWSCHMAIMSTLNFQLFSQSALNSVLWKSCFSQTPFLIALFGADQHSCSSEPQTHNIYLFHFSLLKLNLTRFRLLLNSNIFRLFVSLFPPFFGSITWRVLHDHLISLPILEIRIFLKFQWFVIFIMIFQSFLVLYL